MQKTQGMKILAVIFVLQAVALAVVGAVLAQRQHLLIRRAEPVTATVLSSQVLSRSSKNGVTYYPAITYQYTVQSRTRTADRVFPLPIRVSTSNRRWAEGIVADYPVGRKVPAYYDPQNPDRAFLVRRHDFFPYMLVLIPLPFLCVGVALLSLRETGAVRPPVPVPSASGWFEVLPAFTITAKRRAAWSAFCVWDTVGFAALLHYALVVKPPYETTALVAGGLYLALGAAAFVFALYFTVRAQTFTEARVFINRAEVTRGEPVKVAVRQKVHEAIFTEQARVIMVCEETAKSGNKITRYPAWEESAVLQTDLQVAPGQALEAGATFTIPATQPPSSPPRTAGYPRHDWSLRLSVKVPGKPDYRATFPIVVK